MPSPTLPLDEITTDELPNLPELDTLDEQSDDDELGQSITKLPSMVGLVHSFTTVSKTINFRSSALSKASPSNSRDRSSVSFVEAQGQPQPISRPAKRKPHTSTSKRDSTQSEQKPSIANSELSLEKDSFNVPQYSTDPTSPAYPPHTSILSKNARYSSDSNDQYRLSPFLFSQTNNPTKQEAITSTSCPQVNNFLITRQNALTNLKRFNEAVKGGLLIKVDNNFITTISPSEAETLSLSSTVSETDIIFKILYQSINALKTLEDIDQATSYLSVIIDYFRARVVDFETDQGLDELELLQQSYN